MAEKVKRLKDLLALGELLTGKAAAAKRSKRSMRPVMQGTLNLGRNKAKRARRDQENSLKGPAKTPKGTNRYGKHPV